jgi:glutamine amidotransferase
MKITIVDYGMGNLYSIANVIEYLGRNVVVSSDRNILKNSDIVVLPGVGSFGRAIQALESTGLDDAIREYALIKKKKIIGICLGMQLLAQDSEEGGTFKGLDIIKTSVKRFQESSLKKIPHIGFNEVEIPTKGNILFDGIKNNSDFYFLHSYKLNDLNIDGYKALCTYGGERFIAAYEYNNIFATQFHPEKSQTNGLILFKNFLAT